MAWTGVAPPRLAVTSEPSVGFDVSTEDAAAETAPDGKYSLDVCTADVTETAGLPDAPLPSAFTGALE